jgi:hypothetical protein
LGHSVVRDEVARVTKIFDIMDFNRCGQITMDEFVSIYCGICYNIGVHIATFYSGKPFTYDIKQSKIHPAVDYKGTFSKW